MEICAHGDAPQSALRVWQTRIKKRRRSAALKPLVPTALRCRRFLLLGRTGVLALGIDVAVDEFDHGHRRVVTVAEARLDDAGVAALTVLVAGRQRVEQLPDLVEVTQLGDRLAAQRQPALLAEGNELLDD